MAFMKFVKANGYNIPLEDYRELRAYEYGFDSYQELVDAGYDISIDESCIIEEEWEDEEEC
ncbi:MAG: hypothetical protein E7257_01665 [Lachnospiraceae bacterium]|nr:hypothetical protein [Lachnospiraceae bacterium]